MDKREWLAHRALQAATDCMSDPNNPKKAAAFDDAIQALCPACEYTILYCRCYESVPLNMLSQPNRNPRGGF